MIFVPRSVKQLCQLPDGGSDTEAVGLDSLRPVPAWVLLGEPGAGKSEAFKSLMASPNSPTRGHPKFPQAAQPDYDASAWTAKRAAASLSL